MKLKNVFLSVGMFVFAFAMFGLVSVGKAEATTITAVGSGPWSTAGTWSPATVPTNEDVVIPSGKVVTVTAGAAAASVTINNTGAATGINIDSGITLTVSGATTLTAPTVDGTSTLAIGAGTLATNSLAIAGGTVAKISEVTVSTGTLTVNPGNVILSGTAANARLTSTGASTIRTYGTLSDGGTILDTGGTTWTVDGITTISSLGSLTFSATTGTNHTFTGAVTVDIGGVYTETVAVTPVVFSGAFNNNGTSTILTGTHTFTGIVTNTGTFNLANDTIPIFAASTQGTINYNGVTQAVRVIKYYNLTLGGSGTKTLAANVGPTNGITGTLAISGTIVNLTGNSEANALTIGGTLMRPGTWGSSGSTAANNKNAAFTNDSYYVTVATGPHNSTTPIMITTYPYVAPVITTAPSGLSVSINAGVSTTSSLSSTLTLTAIDATQMLISNDAGFAGASWESYATSKAWTLTSGDGVKTVYAKFKDDLGNTSIAVIDAITVSGSGTVATPNNEPTGGCSAGNLYNASTGALCVNNAGAEIPGCGNRNTGFSSATGGSCANNRVTVAGTPNAPGASGYNFGNSTLKNGSRGAAVMELQRFLNAKLNLGLVLDGKLGPKTIAVIKKWQLDNGLVSDGLVGPKTKAKMNGEVR